MLRHPSPQVDPVDYLRFRMSSSGLGSTLAGWAVRAPWACTTGKANARTRLSRASVCAGNRAKASILLCKPRCQGEGGLSGGNGRGASEMNRLYPKPYFPIL